MLYQLSFLALTQHVGNQNVLKDTFYAGVVLIAAFYDFFCNFLQFQLSNKLYLFKYYLQPMHNFFISFQVSFAKHNMS